VEGDTARVNLSRFLTGIGLTEIMTNSISQSKFYDEEGLIKLANSMTADLDAMRPEMLPSGLEVLRHNINRQQHDLALFEFGKTYKKEGEGFKEEQKLSIYLSGNIRKANWMGKAMEAGFFQAKGLVDAISQKLGLGTLKFGEAKDAMLDYGLVSQRGKFEMLRFGEVKGKLLKQMDIKQPVFYIEFNWDAVLKSMEQSKIKLKDIPRFPAVRRDLALLLDESVSFEELSKLALKQGKQLLNSVDLFDIYRGDKIGEGKKSYAISLVFQDPDKTLTDKDVDGVIDNIVSSMEQELKASIRK
jgi:phenylalanyl-tRNA synthetase beta chain